MKPLSINLKSLTIAVADPNAYIRRLLSGILRSFGAPEVLEIETSTALRKVLLEQKLGMLICDVRLKPKGAIEAIKLIRQDEKGQNRTVPILVLSSDTRDIVVKAARDAGANMFVAKPFSPKTLYDKLTWLALNPRPFVDSSSYFGPDRRFKIEGYPGGVGQRAGDTIEVAEESGPALGQNEIDNLFSATQTGQS